jgi:hypothetical protein
VRNESDEDQRDERSQGNGRIRFWPVCYSYCSQIGATG